MTDARPPQKPCYDDLLEDIFGLNIRGLKSLWMAIRRPRKYYQASRDADWLDTFTPSFRLWFTLVALTFFFQFFWARADSAIIQQLATQITASGTLPDGVSPVTAALTFSKWNYGLLPFFTAASLSFLALIYRAFGEKLNYIERQRRIFVTVIPSAFMSIFVTLGFGLLINIAAVLPLFLTSLIVIMLVDGVTAYRGAFAQSTGRLWRAACLAISITIVSGIAAMMSQVVTMAIIYFRFGG